MIRDHSTLLTAGIVLMTLVTFSYAGYVLWLDWRESRDSDDGGYHDQ